MRCVGSPGKRFMLKALRLTRCSCNTDGFIYANVESKLKLLLLLLLLLLFLLLFLLLLLQFAATVSGKLNNSDTECQY